MHTNHFIFSLLIALLLVACNATNTDKDSQVSDNQSINKKKNLYQFPEEVLGELFVAVQDAKIFPDAKSFVDCTPKTEPSKILAEYLKIKSNKDFDLKKFIEANFEMPENYTEKFKSDNTQSVSEHINRLWPFLTREPSEKKPFSTLVDLPKSYVVPGGRFREVYYWDSYFTMLGLQTAGKADLIENMLDNFAFLIDEIGFIPNGNRTYYLSRSQPPFFSLMVNILAEMKGEEVWQKYLPALQKEYDFWMDGTNKLNADNQAFRRVVRMADGSILNRYWDDRDTPRAEMYGADVETAKETKDDKALIYRDLRASAESGWDFSSRWFRDLKTLSTIHTTEIIPSDLNALLYQLEVNLAKAYSLKKDKEKANQFQELAEKRKKTVLKYLWNEKQGFFNDYDFVKQAFTPVISLAGMYPFCVQIGSEAQASQAAEVIKNQFLKAGGVLTTLHNTGQQWDAPNGWAPLQWMTYWALKNYQKQDLANELKKRWLNLNEQVFKKTGKMLEKYNVSDLKIEAGGGEYPNQDGFGWTNGVYLKMKAEK